ncbi:DsbE family thiol:disulfide interchange protein [Pseudotabrizicola alkalilacus]|uniref:DsbE family thiol:disulfide interchange protein n=1 Tax=Pseudotabrizicola alkalilacus TaxID=2305252 RepID=A0A411Z417_9RHOB|nr:DsbE family thiol:disulfide interchange protein [Pseudotabrizicola alkalilacus]RGP37795.1 DsbE family thiol:disulfide interchange protein [Pseudotabrizicola alkalilacus]
MAKWLMVLPPVIFVGLATVLYVGMMRKNPNDLPTAFQDRAAPVVPATGLAGVQLLTDADLRTGEVTVVNFWATWCPPCRAEHPVLMEMAADGVRVAGINIRDDDAKALAYLAEEGNPFFGVATDPQSRNAVEWGVAAPPETFILRGDGTVAMRFIGPLIGSDYENRFKPALAAALAAQTPG